jgi:cysteine desulfurase
MRNAIYLDHNATTPVLAPVAQAMGAALMKAGNASSVHGFGRAQNQRVAAARAEVAQLTGARPQNVIFTSGGTEANNLALTGSGRGLVIVTEIEHDSVLRAVDDPVLAPVGPDGIVDCAWLADRLGQSLEPALVCVMLANNETGAIQPVAAIAEVARRHGALVHCDAVQAAGRLPLDLDRLSVSSMALSAHKIGGPQGVGALVLAADTALAPQLRGGGQERGRRAGTENVAGIVGFGVAARLAQAERSNASEALRDTLETRLRAAMPDAVVFGATAPRLGNTSCFAVPGLPAQTQLMALDLAGVAVSAGSACSSGKVSQSHVLRAMKVAPDLADCAIRVSFGPGNCEDDIARLLDILLALRGRIGQRQPAA